MSIRSLAVLAVFPLLWATTAMAEAPPPIPDQAAAAPNGGDDARFYKEICTERYAYSASRLAYLEAKLDLTDKQRPAWNKWSQWSLDAANKARVVCLSDTPQSGSSPTALEREIGLEKFLAGTLAGLQASRPALQALYETLTPEQRAIFDRSSGWPQDGAGGVGGHHHSRRSGR